MAYKFKEQKWKDQGYEHVKMIMESEAGVPLRAQGFPISLAGNKTYTAALKIVMEKEYEVEATMEDA